jgi:hypothetical protein
MTDRELLEAAAKAAGIGLAPHPFLHRRGEGALTTDGAVWNPLTDDGDALRLAVKLRIDIVRECTCCVTARRPDMEDEEELVMERFRGFEWDDCNGEGQPKEVVLQTEEAATRRAVVCAAAAIGSAA